VDDVEPVEFAPGLKFPPVLGVHTLTDFVRFQPHSEAPEPIVPPAIRRRDVTIYACPTCETRYHGQQWCHDCNQPCTRVGLGGLCPHCAEPVALTDLIDTPPAAPNC